MYKDGTSKIAKPEVETEAGYTHEITVEDADHGVARYLCTAHVQQGMKGAHVVADPDEKLSEFAHTGEAHHRDGQIDALSNGLEPVTVGDMADHCRVF